MPVASCVSKDGNAEAGHEQRLAGPYRVLNAKYGKGLLYVAPRQAFVLNTTHTTHSVLCQTLSKHFPCKMLCTDVCIVPTEAICGGGLG